MEMKSNSDGFWFSVWFCPTGDGHAGQGVEEIVVKGDSDIIGIPSFQDERFGFAAQQLSGDITAGVRCGSVERPDLGWFDEGFEPMIVPNCQGGQDAIGNATEYLPLQKVCGYGSIWAGLSWLRWGVTGTQDDQNTDNNYAKYKFH